MSSDILHTITNSATTEVRTTVWVDSHVVRGAGGLVCSPNSTSPTPGHDTHYTSWEDLAVRSAANHPLVKPCISHTPFHLTVQTNTALDTTFNDAHIELCTNNQQRLQLTVWDNCRRGLPTYCKLLYLRLVVWGDQSTA
eukprot:jgi/Chrzof1/15192/Cz09g31040.t1